jgi:CreA protein
MSATRRRRATPPALGARNFFAPPRLEALHLPRYFAHIGDGVALEVAEMKRSKLLALIPTVFMLSFGAAPALADNGPDLIFRKSVDFKLLTPNDKLATYAIDDPIIDGVACYYTAHEKGGVAGMFGVAEQSSEVSLACRQVGPINFKEKFSQGDTAFSERRSLLFKRMHIVRGCDAKRNVLVYMVYSDKLVEGSPESSTSTVAIQPWTGQNAVPQCGEFLNR